jgi:glycosyltransferase involved in cell wall biosynthesis/predicted Zn-dependent protease
MDRPYLLGPVNREFAEKHLWRHWPDGACKVFDFEPGVDVVVRPEQSWEVMLQSLPGDWRPAFLVLQLQYRVIPPWLFEAPVPIVAFAGDWNLQWHHYRQVATCCDLILTDRTGAERFERAGIAQARPAILFGGQRAFLDTPWPAVPRDIDVLLIGNFHHAVQSERLPLLGQLATLRPRWNVLFATNVYGEEYRRLLARSRIVFNRGIRGEWNMRVTEALAAGALLMQDAECREVFGLLEDGKECVAYTPDNLLALTEHFLEHEEERRAIAEAGRARVQEFAFGRFLQEQLDVIDRKWDALVERAARRIASGTRPSLAARAWQANPAALACDPTLCAELEAAVAAEPQRADLLCSLGRVQSMTRFAQWPQAAAAVLPHYQRAWSSDPTHIVAGLNAGEALLDLGRVTEAAEQMRATLAALEVIPELPAGVLDAGHYRPEYDHFRVRWEQAAWEYAGDPVQEAHAKRQLLRWRLHLVLGDLTGGLEHYEQAAAAQPNIPVSWAAFGCALARAGRIAEAAPHLQRAVTGNPFDRDAARALFQALGMTGRQAEQAALAEARRNLAATAPQLIAPEQWFAVKPVSHERHVKNVPHENWHVANVPHENRHVANVTHGTPMAIVWEGDQCLLHSLSLVNRAFCQGLIERGHELALLPESRVPGEAVSVPPRLAECFHRPLSRPADVHIRQQWPPNFTPPAAGHWVVMQPWEFGSLPREWVTPLVEQVDEVWANTRYVRDVYVQSGVPAERVHVVPLGVRVDQFRPDRAPYALKTAKRCRFLFVGGTIWRKGIDVLLAAYARAFRRHDDVCLVIKDMGVGTFYQGQTSEARIAQLQAQPDAPEIEYISHSLSDDELAGLYTACSVLVHPYRGEGFGLPIAEAMASGIPAIVTGMGAALDFCTADTGYLIPAYKRFVAEKRIGDMETIGQPWLAEPDVDALTALMQFAAANPEDVRRRGERAAEHIRRHFTWEQAVTAAERRLLTLRDQPIRRSSRLAKRTARVSLCIIARNEERFLADCLESVRDLVDEIIIVDSGSTDRTKEIASRFGAKVIDFTWVDSFAAARNESLKHATGDWILWLDADERLDAVNRTRLRELLARLGTENIAYVMRQQSRLEAGPHATVHVDQVRLFRNLPGLAWRYRVHEQILLSLRALGADVQQTDIVIEHVGFAEATLQGPKVERNLRLLQLELAEHPDDTFVLYNLGAVAMTLGQTDEALGYFQRFTEQAEPTDNLFPKVHALITRCHHHAGRKDVALQRCRQGRSAFPHDAEMLFWEAVLLHEQNDLSGAERSLTQLLALPRAINFTSADSGMQGHRARQFLAEICEAQGRCQDAVTHLRQVLAECPGSLTALRMLAQCQLELRAWSELEQTLRALRQHPEEAAQADLLLGRAHLARQEFAAARAVLEALNARVPDAIWPKVILSYALLQEEKDLHAAEAVLRDIVALDPNQTEARHNLQALLARRSQPQEPALAVNGEPPAPAVRQRVSLCIIAKDEEENLPLCIPPLRKIVDQIIVVDTGSSDRTVEVAKSLGAEVYHFPWVDSFAAARNEALKHATGDWIFWMDADDCADSDNVAKLQALFAGLRDENAAHVMTCRCLPDPVTQATTEVHHLRLFRNRSDVRWEFRVHEQILPAIRATRAQVRWTDVVIHHTGYQNLALRARKLERDLRLLLMEDAERPDNPFILFNLGQVYQEQRRLPEALDAFRRSLAGSAPDSSITRKLYAMIAQCLNQMERREEAVAACRDGQAIYPDDIEILFQEGIASRAMRNPWAAIQCWEQILRTPRGDHFESLNVGIRGYLTRYNLATAYRDVGRLAECEAQFRAILAEVPDYQPAWISLGELYVTQQRWSDIETLARQVESLSGGKLDAELLRARALLGRQEYAEAQARSRQLAAEYPTALEPLVYLSHAYLQEGRDWDAAEKAILAILALDPSNQQARNNLICLCQQQGKPIPAQALATPAELYHTACTTPSDLSEHCPTLLSLSKECRHITELGTRTGLSTTTFLFAGPKKLVCYASTPIPQLEALQAHAAPTNFVYQAEGKLPADIEETDLLFLDLERNYEPVAEALRRYAAKVRRYIVVPGTVKFMHYGQSPGCRGVWPAVNDFLADGAFRLKEQSGKQEGMAVLERV